MVYVNPIFVCVYRYIRSVIYPGLHTRQFKLLNTASLATRKLYNVTIIFVLCTRGMLNDCKGRVKEIWYSWNPTITIQLSLMFSKKNNQEQILI